MSKSSSQRRSVAKRKGTSGGKESASIISPQEASSEGTPSRKQDAKLHDSTTIVTPVGKIPAKQGKQKSSKPKAARTLFPSSAPSISSAVLVSPQPNKQKEYEDEEFAIAKRKREETKSTRPPAKRRLMFGRLVEIAEPMPNVSQVYRIVNKLTGSLGGNGYSGPIYGELTMGSMQKMIDLMMEHTHLTKQSRFIDVGSGIGKPNLHVAQYPGVAFSCGVEMEHTRWSLGMTCLKAVLDEAQVQQQQQQQQQDKPSEERIQGNCMFLHNNILEAKTFDPFTHVYMFSIGFPPTLWTKLAEMWNNSGSSVSGLEPEGTRNCEYLICYHSPKAIIDDYEFNVELLAQMPTSMHGSKEGHMGYIYKRKEEEAKNNRKSLLRPIECDPLFQPSWDLVQQGLDSLHKHVSKQLEETLGGGRRTRRSKQRALTRASDHDDE